MPPRSASLLSPDPLLPSTRMTVALHSATTRAILGVVVACVLLVLHGGNLVEIRGEKSLWKGMVVQPPCSIQQKNAPGTCTDIYDGKWVYNPDKPRPELNYLAAEGSVANSEGPRLASSNDTFNAYIWVPNEPACQMVEWDTGRMCRMLQRANVSSVLFVGDSLSTAYALSLYYMGGGKEYMRWMAFSSKICEGKVTVSFVRNDMLYVRPFVGYTGIGPLKDIRLFRNAHPEIPEQEGEFVEWVVPWTSWLTDKQVDLLVLNTGAHIRGMDFFKAAIDEAVAYLKAHYRGRIIYRTSHLGHTNCTRDIDIMAEDEVSPPLLPEQLAVFRWDLHHKYNNYAVDAFKNELGAEIAYADKLLKLRRDGHVGGADCLHYRMPGPADWGTKVWYTDWLLNKYPEGEDRPVTEELIKSP